MFQCPHGLELLHAEQANADAIKLFQCPHGLELLLKMANILILRDVFQCPHGLELFLIGLRTRLGGRFVSRPSRA